MKINMELMQESVAITAPAVPAIRMPTKVAQFTAIGPGVISAIVIRLVNSPADIHLFISTTCS